MNDLSADLGIPRDEILARLKAELADLLALDSPDSNSEVTISEETRLVEDLDIDSLGMVDLVMRVEDCFDVTLPTNFDLSQFKTLGDIVNVLDGPQQSECGSRAAG